MHAFFLTNQNRQLRWGRPERPRQNMFRVLLLLLASLAFAGAVPHSYRRNSADLEKQRKRQDTKLENVLAQLKKLKLEHNMMVK